MKILIVEDELTSRVILKEVLKAHGSIDFAANGALALEAVRAGFESGAPGRTKILMTTALDDEKNISDAKEGQCDGYLVKPLRKAVLLGELERIGLL